MPQIDEHAQHFMSFMNAMTVLFNAVLLSSDVYLSVIFNVSLMIPTTPIPPRFISSDYNGLEFGT